MNIDLRAVRGGGRPEAGDARQIIRETRPDTPINESQRYMSEKQIKVLILAIETLIF